jgi:hypothetical protein
MTQISMGAARPVRFMDGASFGGLADRDSDRGHGNSVVSGKRFDSSNGRRGRAIRDRCVEVKGLCLSRNCCWLVKFRREARADSCSATGAGAAINAQLSPSTIRLWRFGDASRNAEALLRIKEEYGVKVSFK